MLEAPSKKARMPGVKKTPLLPAIHITGLDASALEEPVFQMRKTRVRKQAPAMVEAREKKARRSRARKQSVASHLAFRCRLQCHSQQGKSTTAYFRHKVCDR